MSKVKITWLGHTSIKLDQEGNTVFFDPWIRDNPACPINIEQIKKADAICVTHGHNDHIGDSIELVKETAALLICSPEIGFYAERHAIKYDSKSLVAILPVGGKYNMGFREAGYAAFLVHPKYFLPIHYDTFLNQRLNFDQLKNEIKEHARSPSEA